MTLFVKAIVLSYSACTLPDKSSMKTMSSCLLQAVTKRYIRLKECRIQSLSCSWNLNTPTGCLAVRLWICFKNSRDNVSVSYWIGSIRRRVLRGRSTWIHPTCRHSGRRSCTANCCTRSHLQRIKRVQWSCGHHHHRHSTLESGLEKTPLPCQVFPVKKTCCRDILDSNGYIDRQCFIQSSCWILKCDFEKTSD